MGNPQHPVEQFRTLYERLSVQKHPSRLDIYQELSEQARRAAAEIFDAFPQLSKTLLFPSFVTREGQRLMFSDRTPEQQEQLRQQLLELQTDYGRLEQETNTRVIVIARQLIVEIRHIIAP